MNIIYCLFKLLPTQNKITYISRQMNTTPDDFKRIKEYYMQEDPTIKHVILAKMIPDNLIGKIGYCFHIFTQMYHIATSKVVILDTYCIVISILHHKNDLVVIQIWHALGAFKKFGYSILGSGEGSSLKMASLMRMHKNYTYVTTSSEYTLPYFQEAFHQKRENMVVFPLPRLDLLYDVQAKNEIKNRIYQKYPILQNSTKPIVVYAPTFRKGQQDTLKQGIQALVDELCEEYIIVLKKHPLTTWKLDDSRIIEDDTFDSIEMFTIADDIITDYSASMYEASVLSIPIYFYAFDYDEYLLSRNFYESYEDLIAGPMSKEVKTLHQQLNDHACKVEEIKVFSQKMIQPFKFSYTKDLCDFIKAHSSLN